MYDSRYYPQQIYPQQTYPQQAYQNYGMQQAAPQNDKIFVANQMAADAYLVAPNGYVQLWDSSRPVFYEKRADAQGRYYPLEVYEYKRVEAGSVLPTNDIEELSKRVERLEHMLEGGKQHDANE